MSIYDKDENEHLKSLEKYSRQSGKAINDNEGLNDDSSTAKEKEALDQATASENSQTSSTANEDSGIESNPVDNNDKGFYKPNGKSRFARLRGSFFTRKSAIGGGALVIMAGGAIWTATILSGPAQLIQLAEILDRVHFGNNQSATESRLGRMFEYFRTTNDKSKRNVGYTMELISSHYREGLVKDGITMEFDRADGSQSRRLQGLTIDTSTPKGKEAADRLRAQGYTISADGRLDLTNESRSFRKNALKAAVDMQNRSRKTSAIAKRVLIHRAGVDFHPIRNIKDSARDSWANRRARRQQERSEHIKQGVDPTGNGTLSAQEELDENGNPTEESQGRERTANEGNSVIREGREVKTRAQRLSLAQKLAGGAAAGVVSALCVVKDVGNSIPLYQHANITLPAIRMAMIYISAGSQVEAMKDINLDEVGFLIADLYDEETGTSAWTAAAMQATKGEPVTGPDSKVKPSDVGDKPLLFDIVDSISPIGLYCQVSNSIFGLVRSIPIIGSVVGTVEQWGESGINAALAGFGLGSIDELMEDLVAFLSGDMLDTIKGGAVRGNNIAIGALLAGNDACVSKGCKPLSTAQALELKKEQDRWYQESYKQKPVFARIFDPYSANSLLSKMIIQNPGFASLNSSLRSVSMLPVNLGDLFSNSLLKLSPTASAATTPGYDFGVPAFGFDMGELESESFADPYENADFVEPRLNALNSRYGECFGTVIHPETFALENRESVNYTTDRYKEKCAEPSDPAAYEEFTRYRFYILDTITAKSAACYEGLDETACAELGFGANAASATPGASGLITADGYSFPLEPQTQAVGGINQGHHDGTPAFDLFSKEDANVYAIFDGQATRINRKFNGVEGCSSIQFRADDGFYYWYGHLKNVTISEDTPVAAGTPIAQVADASFGSACVGGGPHLHVDRGCTRNGVPQPGGTDACRDPDFIPFLRSLWDTLPSG